ncbi:PREDICTED: enhancer of split m4 protein [Rhagoletis zephyria]|uniref:enhancer of split m4 protein n=2 Tax=Rhagoletis zephyria TaxID=28612 RepID=UPI00081193E1|nr:PREDICTED: enhancer of split m4 protein [Rhagoletis zephyria]
MCTEQYENNVNMTAEQQLQQRQKKVSYSIKRLLRQLFKQQQKSEQQKQQQELIENFENTNKANSLESLESLENSRNADLESEAECISLESSENDANERLAASCELEDYEFADISSVPVHFLRTAHGTFFWTANNDLPADNDLIEPLYCSTGNQIATTQMQDRWAQA